MECSPSTAKKLLKRKSLTIMLNRHRIVKYVKILRCSNCQQFGHTQRFCTNPSICGICAHSHHTNECDKSDNQEEHLCINCTREGYRNNHKASAIHCPAYQELKSHFLSNYYGKGQNQTNNQEINEETEIEEDEQEVIEHHEQEQLQKINKTYINEDRVQKNFFRRYNKFMQQEQKTQRNQQVKKDVRKLDAREILELQKKRNRQLQEETMSKQIDAREILFNKQKKKLDELYQKSIESAKAQDQRDYSAALKSHMSKNTTSSLSKASEIPTKGIAPQSTKPMEEDQISFNPKNPRESHRTLDKYYRNPPPPFTTLTEVSKFQNHCV